MDDKNKTILEEMKKTIKQEFDVGNVAFSTFIEPLEELSIKNGNIEITMNGNYIEIGALYIIKKWGIFLKKYLYQELEFKGEIRFISQDGKVAGKIATDN